MGSRVMDRVILEVRSQGLCSFRRLRQGEFKVRDWEQDGVRLGRKRVQL